MTPELHAAVMALSPAEKYQLIDDIQASIPETDDEPWADALYAEIQRRMALSDADPSRLIPGDVFLTRLRERYAR